MPVPERAATAAVQIARCRARGAIEYQPTNPTFPDPSRSAPMWVALALRPVLGEWLSFFRALSAFLRCLRLLERRVGSTGAKPGLIVNILNDQHNDHGDLHSAPWWIYLAVAVW